MTGILVISNIPVQSGVRAVKSLVQLKCGRMRYYFATRYKAFEISRSFCYTASYWEIHSNFNRERQFFFRMILMSINKYQVSVK